MPWIHFVDQKFASLEVPLGANLMKALQDNGIPVASSCGGEAVCAKCRLSVEPAGEPSEEEEFLLKKFKLSSPLRISCQVYVLTDLKVSASYW